MPRSIAWQKSSWWRFKMVWSSSGRRVMGLRILRMTRNAAPLLAVRAMRMGASAAKQRGMFARVAFHSIPWMPDKCWGFAGFAGFALLRLERCRRFRRGGAGGRGGNFARPASAYEADAPSVAVHRPPVRFIIPQGRMAGAGWGKMGGLFRRCSHVCSHDENSLSKNYATARLRAGSLASASK